MYLELKRFRRVGPTSSVPVSERERFKSRMLVQP